MTTHTLPGRSNSALPRACDPPPVGRCSGEHGFTLVETVIGLVILSLGILAVASLSSTSQWQVQRGQDLTNSAVLVQEVLEGIADMPFDSVSVGKHSDTTTVGGTTYSIVWEVVDASDSLASGGSEIKLITVYVSGGMTQTSAEQFDMAIYSGGS